MKYVAWIIVANPSWNLRCVLVCLYISNVFTVLLVTYFRIDLPYVCIIELGRILKFTFEHSLIKCLNIQSFGVNFQVTGFFVFMHILLFLILFNKFGKCIAAVLIAWKTSF